MGDHHTRSSAAEFRRTPRTAWYGIGAIAAVVLGAMVWLWPGELDVAPQQSSRAQVAGTVTSVETAPCPPAPEEAPGACRSARVVLDEGPDAGREVVASVSGRSAVSEVGAGDHVVVVGSGDAGQQDWFVVDHQRGTGLVVLVIAFGVALVAFGRWRGLSALVGLGVTFAILVFFVVPAILAGGPPLLVAIVGSGAIMLTVLYITHGTGLATTIALVGTLISLVITGILSALTVGALRLTGVTDEISASVGTNQGINTEGLLLAAIVIGSLGVLDDVTVTQAAIVTELARANPGYGVRRLHLAGMRVGRSHIASVVNTIVLAYAGSSLPLLIIIIANEQGLGGVVTDQVIAQEIVRSVVATLGLIAAVPLTTGLAALTFRRAEAVPTS